MLQHKKTLAASIVCVLLCAVMLTVPLLGLSGCQAKYNRDEQYLFCLNAHIYDIRPVVETTLTTEYVGDLIGAMGAKRMRLNMAFQDLFTVDRDNNVVFKESQKAGFHKVVEKYKSVGVTSILAVTDTFLYPYDYDASIPSVVPDPLLERDEYILWCKLQGEAFRMIAEEYPEIRYFEPCNEPDMPNGMMLAKNGCAWEAATANFIFPDDDEGHILADLMWYCNAAVKTVSPDCTVVVPGLCAFISSIDYLDYIYQAIESGCHPTGGEVADTNTNNYFGILNWHPYPSVISDSYDAEWMKTEWANFNLQMYAVAQKHGDDGKLVWLTELGFTDKGFGQSTEEEIASYVAPIFDTIKKKLPFVESVFWWRPSNLYDTRWSTAEDNFGMFRALGDPDRGGEPKPVAKALYSYFHNGTDDYSELYAVAQKHKK